MKPERSFTRPTRSLCSKILWRGGASRHTSVLLAPGLSALPCGLLIFFFLEPGFRSAEAGSASTKAEAFLQAYPNFFSGFKDNTLLFRDGGGIQFDDGRSKTYEELLANPDPEDELSQNYPTGSQSYSPPP